MHRVLVTSDLMEFCVRREGLKELDGGGEEEKN
jgi:hypothetical protein